MKFDYYYGIEADSFNYIPVPKILMTDPQFKILSAEAVLLYSIMLNRMSLSRKNEWFDDENRVYIIFTLEEIIETIGRAHTKCVNILKELETVGLIERKKRGLGKPDIIYVKDFLHAPKVASNTDKITDFSKREVKTSPNENSGLHESRTPDFSKREASNTNINNTDNNKTEMSYTNPLPLLQKEETKKEKADEEEEIKNQINYDRLLYKHPANKKLLAFILSQIIDMISETNPTVEISSGHFEPKSKVMERLNGITYDDIESLLLLLPDKGEDKIKNPVGYMRKCLFNLVERRGAVCFTQQIKHKGGNNGLIHCEYDFDELNASLGI